MSSNNEILATYWWHFSKELRERLCYSARVDYKYANKRWIKLSEDKTTRLAPRVQLEIHAYQGFSR